MATTDVEICNLALFRIRADEIGDISEQSVNAEKCRVLYPQARDIVLTDFPWPFNKTTKALSAKVTTLDEWEYCFDYPSDCIRVRYLIPTDSSGNTIGGVQVYDSDPIEFEVMLDSNGSLAIGTNYEYAKLCYSKSITDVRLWDNLVDDMIAWRLAMDLAIPLGGDSAKKYRDDAERNYFTLAGQAKAKASNEAWPRKPKQKPKSIQARGDYLLSRDELITRSRGY